MPVARNTPRTFPLSSVPVRSKLKISCMPIGSSSMPVISEMVVTLRVPSERRAICTTACTADAIWWRTARSGMFRFAMETMFSTRAMASRGELAWTVVSEPSWPVFMACNISKASSPRTSPTTMRSGRIRRLLITSCRCRTAPLPSMLGGRVSRRTTCSCFELQFGGVFDGDDAVGVGDVSGEHIQQSRLAGASSTGDQDVEAPFHHGREQFEHRLGEGLILDHLARGDGLASKTADGEAGAVNGQRRNDGVDARSIGQTGVDHGRRFVDAPADARDDALNDLHEMRVVFEGQARCVRACRRAPRRRGRNG